MTRRSAPTVVGALMGFAALMALTPVPSADAQLAPHYRGAARRSVDPHAPASLELSMFSQNDTVSTGWLAIGPPLARGGITAVFKQGGDSLFLVTASTSGDTILWLSPHPTEALGGEYRIIAGQYAGQSGEWSLRPDPVTPGSARISAAFGVAVLLLGVIIWLAKRLEPVYWRRRFASAQTLSEWQERDWTHIGGWLAFFALGAVGTIVYLLATIGETASTIAGGVWMLGAAVPGFRAGLFVEGTAHFLQLLGTILGVLLLFRRSTMAPIYWVLMLAIALVYAIYDLAAMPGFRIEIETMLGSSLDADTESEITTAAARNARLIGYALLWSLYWMVSKRVFARFSPARPTTAADADGNETPSADGAHSVDQNRT